MTENSTPIYAMTVKAGESLLNDLSRSIGHLDTAQKTTKARYSNWRAVSAAPPVTGGNAEFGAMLGSFLLDFLFGGLPILQGLSGSLGALSEAGHGLVQLGLLAGVENDGTTCGDFDRTAQLRALSKAGQNAQYRRTLTAQSQQKQQMQMLMLVLMNLLAAAQGDETSGGSGGEALVPDVLRHPTLARFKQNRQSVSCIRTLFQRETIVTAPRFAALRCA